VNFEEYLQSKKIDSAAFKNQEGDLWQSWKKEFEEVHPTSFTAQKLYLINPIRRKYQLKVELPNKAENQLAEASKNAETKSTEKISEIIPPSEPQKPAAKMPPAKPVFRPKPKMN
jgi:hypothetical protein